MLIIHKYQLSLHGTTTLQIPKGYQILTVQFQIERTASVQFQSQRKASVVWIAHSDATDVEDVMLQFTGLWTGESFPTSPGQYLATIQTDSGMVTHYFVREGDF